MTNLRLIKKEDLLTPKQEKFCKLVANGETLSDAYRQSYNVRETTQEKSIWQSASRLMNNIKVTSRIDVLINEMKASELHEEEKKKTFVLSQLQKIALDGDTSASKVSALSWIGKSIGMFTDKVEQTTEDRTSSDIETELKRKLADLMK